MAYSYSPYDWQQTLHQKAEYVEDRLKRGSPVVALSCVLGILLLTIRGSQRKIFEIYDRLVFTGLGNPADLEVVRHQTVDFTHLEGYQRSPEDVSIQRVVGFSVSPVLKRFFSDPLRMPLVLRGLFTQVGDLPEEDLFLTVNYDGEFNTRTHHAVVAGTGAAEVQMDRLLKGLRTGVDRPLSLEAAIEAALEVWTVGWWHARHGEEGVGSDEDNGEPEGEGANGLPTEEERHEFLVDALADGVVEAVLLEREPQRERRYRSLEDEEVRRFLPPSQGPAEGGGG